jgi:chromosome segregation ATPase
MTNGEDLQREIASLEQARREALDEAEEAERVLADLEGRRNETAGRLEIARSAVANYAARLEERHQALAEALKAAAEAKLLEAVDARDDAANRAAGAIAHLIASFESLDDARAAMAERLAETKSHLPGRVEVDPEPAQLEQEWVRLVAFIRTRAQLRFEDELVEAAASSPRGTYDIEKLPQHLQVLARQRRAERLRAERLRAADEARNERDS